MATYNGHRSWNAWNVSLWLLNEEVTYNWIIKLINKYGKKEAAKKIYEEIGGNKTPDGAIFNKTSIIEALKGL